MSLNFSLPKLNSETLWILFLTWYLIITLCAHVLDLYNMYMFKISRQINDFKNDSTIIFKDITKLLSHFKPLVEYPVVSDNTNRCHSILYFWLIIYR